MHINIDSFPIVLINLSHERLTDIISKTKRPRNKNLERKYFLTTYGIKKTPKTCYTRNILPSAQYPHPS